MVRLKKQYALLDGGLKSLAYHQQAPIGMFFQGNMARPECAANYINKMKVDNHKYKLRGL